MATKWCLTQLGGWMAEAIKDLWVRCIHESMGERGRHLRGKRDGAMFPLRTEDQTVWPDDESRCHSRRPNRATRHVSAKEVDCCKLISCRKWPRENAINSICTGSAAFYQSKDCLAAKDDVFNPVNEQDLACVSTHTVFHKTHKSAYITNALQTAAFTASHQSFNTEWHPEWIIKWYTGALIYQFERLFSQACGTLNHGFDGQSWYCTS